MRTEFDRGEPRYPWKARPRVNHFTSRRRLSNRTFTLSTVVALCACAACSTEDAAAVDDAADAASAHDGSASALDASTGPRRDGSAPDDAAATDAPIADVASPLDGKATDGASPLDAAGDTAGDAAGDASTCKTRVTYGKAWIAPAGHGDAFDDTADNVTWDGTCTDDGVNSYALLSNGWKPYFQGQSACVLALDHTGCSGAPAHCTTRIAYGPTWSAPANHPAHHDDVADRVLWGGRCVADNGSVFAPLSNEWQPHFSGLNGCEISLEYQECGGLYANPVMTAGCADPGVLRDGTRYIMACTSGNATNAFGLHESTDLVHWTSAGSIFPSANKPTWAQGDFWAPEVHRVGAGYVAYFTARHTDGKLSIGAATSATSTGPFTDIGAPLLHDSQMGLIDATEYEAPSGQRYVLWKEDGNAVGKPTPIHIQLLAADGKSVTGAVSTLITNDQPWEGGVVEGPWLVDHGGMYYLFYSGNSYANQTYALGVARATSPLGPYTKGAGPIVVTNATWVGPGHGSLIDTPAGDSYMVYHAWAAGHVNGPGDARLALVDRVIWNAAGWPVVPAAPSAVSLPMP